MDDPGPLPLDDLRILDLTHFYNGPYATMLLSYLGAEVIKIEAPGTGDNGRAVLRHPGQPVGFPFALLNSNKRSITLNLKSAEGRDLFKQMVPKADLVVENFSAGTMDRMGLGFDVLRELNPRLIYATSTGYGLTGPKRDLTAFDPVVQAMAGVMALTGDPDGPPMKAGPAVVDILGGIHFCAGILAAVRQRDRTGAGLMVELCLYESTVPTLTSQIGARYGRGVEQLREGNRATGGLIVPYNAYPASDGWVMMLLHDQLRWRRLCTLLGQPELAGDPRFATDEARIANHAPLDCIIAGWTRNRTRQQVMDEFAANDIFCGMVQELPEVMTDPHLHQRGMLREIEHPQLGPMTIFTSPIRLNGAAPQPKSYSPALGADNDDFYLKELGLDSNQIAALHERKVI
ncbi:MAG TPA: CoA transferase [Candidatus Binataceae bacterium]|nr:CoA transferase [Candidatus Binataceae bacterium]